MFIFWTLVIFQGTGDKIELVRMSFLDLNNRETIARAFESYPWFESFSWKQERNQRPTVVFEGVIEDEKAVKSFEELHKYKLRSNLKAMQLATYYGMTEEKDKLSFVIYFEVEPDDSFRVARGLLGIRHKDGRWRRQPLTDKALLHIIKGLYLNRDPYMILVRGLPFK